MGKRTVEQITSVDKSVKIIFLIKSEGLLYNPINMNVVDDKGLKNADLKAKNKKKDTSSNTKWKIFIV